MGIGVRSGCLIQLPTAAIQAGQVCQTYLASFVSAGNNKYAQLLHFRLVQIHVAGDGRKWYYLTRVDLGHGDKQAQCYSEGDMAEYRPFEK